MCTDKYNFFLDISAGWNTVSNYYNYGVRCEHQEL